MTRPVQQTWVNSFNPELKFSGKEQDTESGLYYFGARYYDPTLYRFLSPDPVIPTDHALYNPQRWNLYGYCLGNPVNFIDPFGDIIINIYRTTYTEYGTLGIYEIELGGKTLRGYTLEPSRERGKGPIPIGEYQAGWFYSTEKKELRIALYDVPGFKNIRIHKGNFPKDTQGCILVGETRDARGNLGGSGKAMGEITREIMNYQLGTLYEAMFEGELDLILLQWLFDMEVRIIDLPEGIVRTEVTSIRPLMN